MSKNTDKLQRLIKKSQKIIPDTITPAVSKELSDKYAQRIRKRTTLGYGVDGSGRQEKLKKLSDEYKDVREIYRENLSSFTSVSKSNLTATGQLLGAMTGEAANAKVVITFKNTRGKDLTGRDPGGLTNRQLARYVQERGRSFFRFTKAERNAFVREVKQLIKAGLKKT